MKPLFYILDEDKNIIPCEDSDKWEAFIKTKKKIIAQELIDNLFVSTVFLGLDHSYGLYEKILFETMVFDENRESISCVRYSTYQEAEEGHKRAVEKIKKGN